MARALRALTSLVVAGAVLMPAAAQQGGGGATRAAPAAASELLVGAQGLTLYPRWNKAFPPVAQLQAGQRLRVLRELGAWKQVQVQAEGDDTGPTTSGWIWCDLPPVLRTTSLTLPVAASPTTSGLVVKGFSPQAYARLRGTDTAALVALTERMVAFEGFARFLAEDPVPVAGPSSEPAPISAALMLSQGDSDRREALSARARRMAEARSASERLAALSGRQGQTLSSLEAAKQGLAGRGALEGDVAALLGEAGALTLGQGVAARLLAESPEVQDAALREYVSFVGLRLADHVPGGRNQWWFAVLDRDDVNAFSTAGGFVFVTDGAVRACDNEAQLAALLAHEMAHVAFGHALAALDVSRHQLMLQAAGDSLTEQLPETDPEALALVDELSVLGDELLSLTRKSFGHVVEHEADGLSIQVMQRAGYDPHEAVAVLRALARSPEEGRVGGRALGSHPPPVERLVYMRSVLADEQLLSVGSLNEARFRRYVPQPER
ncbi:MAG: hypothetical protein DRQ55_07115 [Planctomycetota bacterium]|nr:MAG: hypothetical protein DRQ55_07115 [Planctomycetota bacterium]